jgi:ParB-like chromosome segregation protein Spo0J
VAGLTMLNAEEVVVRGGPVCLKVGEIRPSTTSLRLGPPNPDHVATLVELNGRWTPILVSARDYSIVDGQHRYLAARQLGHTHIYCSLFTGDADAAFLEALRLNGRQGLALTLKEREQAARRVLESQADWSDWSDRRIGGLCGLSATTVGRLRGLALRPAVQIGQMDSRIGRDDRVRPLDSGALRQRVTKELVARPNASLREIATVSRCSPETVRAVRRAMSSAESEALRNPQSASKALSCSDKNDELADPAFASTGEGAAFMAWFAATNLTNEDWHIHVRHIPLSRVYEIADMARRRSDAWREFARAVEGRVNVASHSPGGDAVGGRVP